MHKKFLTSGGSETVPGAGCREIERKVSETRKRTQRVKGGVKVEDKRRLMEISLKQRGM